MPQQRKYHLSTNPARTLLQAVLAVLTLLAAALGQAGAVEIPTLNSAIPYRLLKDSAGKPQSLDITGTDFDNDGHPNRDEYMHWQIRRDDGSGQPADH